MGMFKFSGYVDDKNVGFLLRNLAGIAYDVQAVPVVNAQLSPGKNGAKTIQEKVPNGKNSDLLLNYMNEKKMQVINLQQIGDFLQSIGKAKGSATWTINKLIQAKKVRRTGKGVYKVVA